MGKLENVESVEVVEGVWEGMEAVVREVQTLELLAVPLYVWWKPGEDRRGREGGGRRREREGGRREGGSHGREEVRKVELVK